MFLYEYDAQGFDEMISIGEYILKGGWVMWPIVALSIASLSFAIQHLWKIRQAGVYDADLLEDVLKLVENDLLTDALNRAKNTPGAVARMVVEFIEHQGDPAWERRVSHVGSRELRQLEGELRWLAVIANISTLVGLYGTVLGMVEVFRVIEISGGPADPAQLAGGIWIALMTTVGGLTVAIPTLLAYNYLLGRVDALAARMKDAVEALHVCFESRKERTK